MNVYFLTAKSKHRVHFLMFDLCSISDSLFRQLLASPGPCVSAHPPTPNKQRPNHPHSLEKGG